MKKTALRITILILLCGLRMAMVIPAKAGIQKGRGRKGKNSIQSLPSTNPISMPWCAGTIQVSDW